MGRAHALLLSMPLTNWFVPSEPDSAQEPGTDHPSQCSNEEACSKLLSSIRPTLERNIPSQEVAHEKSTVTSNQGLSKPVTIFMLFLECITLNAKLSCTMLQLCS